jgi:hypothetical protein
MMTLPALAAPELEAAAVPVDELPAGLEEVVMVILGVWMVVVLV